MVSKTPYSLKATSSKTAPMGKLGRMYNPRKGVARQGATSNYQVQLIVGQPVAMYFQWPPTVDIITE